MNNIEDDLIDLNNLTIDDFIDDSDYSDDSDYDPDGPSEEDNYQEELNKSISNMILNTVKQFNLDLTLLIIDYILSTICHNCREKCYLNPLDEGNIAKICEKCNNIYCIECIYACNVTINEDKVIMSLCEMCRPKEVFNLHVNDNTEIEEDFTDDADKKYYRKICIKKNEILT